MSLEQFIQHSLRLYKRLEFTTNKQQIFLEDLNVLIDDGIPLNRALETLSRLYTGILKEVAIDIATNLSKGLPLAEGMRPWFRINAVELVRVGEEGGVLHQTIKSAADALKEKQGSLSAVIAAILYPLVVLVTGCIVIVYLNHSVFNDFASIKPVNTWPSSGQDLIMLANIIQYWSWLLVIAIIGFIAAMAYLLGNYAGDARSLLNSFPIFSLYKKLMAAQLMETLGLLISNGVVFKSALRIVQYSATPFMLSHLITMEHLLAQGRDNIADVLDTGLISENDILRLRVTAEAKGFEHALIRLGQRATIDSAKTIRRSAKIAGGILLGLGGAMIMFMVVAIYSVGMFLGGT